MSEFLEFLSNLNGWSVIGLGMVCATYAYTQRLRVIHHAEQRQFLADPARTPEQLAAFLRSHPIPQIGEPTSGKPLGLVMLLLAAGLAWRASEVVVARANRTDQVVDFQPDTRPIALPIYSTASR